MSFSLVNKSIYNETKLHVDKANIPSLSTKDIVMDSSGSLTVLGVVLTPTQLSNIQNIGSINGVVSGLDSKASLSGATFSGSISVPSITLNGSDIATQLSAKASLASPVFSGTVICPSMTYNGSSLTTQLSGKATYTALNSYLTTIDAGLTYMPLLSMSNYATISSLSNYLTSSNASLTYTPLSSMSQYATNTALNSYLTSIDAGLTYMPLLSMSQYATTASLSSYLTSSTANGTYTPLSSMSQYATNTALNSYITSSSASSTYQPISGMSVYATTSSLSSYATNTALSSYLTTLSASNLYIPKSNPVFTTDIRIPSLNRIYLRDGTDVNHFLGYSASIDGPVLTGFNGGSLNTGGSAFNTILTWTTATVEIKPTTNSSSTTTGALVVGGGMGIGQNLYVGDSISITNNAVIPNAYITINHVSGASYVSGITYANGGLEITGSTITNGYGIFLGTNDTTYNYIKPNYTLPQLSYIEICGKQSVVLKTLNNALTGSVEKLRINTYNGLNSVIITEELGSIASADSLGTGAGGSLIIKHNDIYGSSSITFPSVNNSTSDYGYIQYNESYGGNNERGRMIIGCENDPSNSGNNDAVILYPCQGSGYVGINNMNPTCSLDVNGIANFRGALVSNSNFYVGVPSSTTAFQMDVAGSARITGQMYSRYNTTIAGGTMQNYPRCISPLVYLIDSGSGSYPFFYNVPYLSDYGCDSRDDYWMIMPRIKLKLWNGQNYTGNYCEYDNTGNDYTVRFYTNALNTTRSIQIWFYDPELGSTTELVFNTYSWIQGKAWV